MRGSIVQLGPNYWRLFVYSGQRNAKGHPVQVTKRFRGPKRVAEAILAEMVGDIAGRTSLARPKATVDELMARWLEHLAVRRAPSTVNGYRLKVARYVSPTLGRTEVAKLSTAQLDATYDSLMRSGLSPATVRQVHAIISSALGQGKKWGWVRSNPATDASPPSVARAERAAIPAAELRALMDEAEVVDGAGGVLPTAIALGALTGCRRGELCALRWSDVDASSFRLGTLHVSRSVLAVPGKRQEGPTKNKRTKHLSLDQVALEVLARRRTLQEANAAALGVELVADPYVLSREIDGSGALAPDGLSHAFARLVDKLWPRQDAKPRWHFHDLRHWSASTLLAGGVDIKTAQARGGWATTSVLLDIYSHALSDRDHAAAAVLGRALTQ